MRSHQQTSLISILSSEHGKLRREQRDIDKRDLQKALKYGSYNRTWNDRWKVEYDGIIFITDSSMKREITAYPSPLANVPVSIEARISHEKAKAVITEKPEMSVTHTVLVMDKSGSMLTHDINLHRDRHTAAYSTTAMEFIAEQLFNGTANNRDRVSLIEFDNIARVVFSSEPVSWVLYNEFLDRQDMSPFEIRERKLWTDDNDSNYMPALDKAEDLLATAYHEDCALSLLFLSDGKPTDFKYEGYTPAYTQRRLRERVIDIALRFGEQLTVTMIGFGNSYEDFSALQSMAHAIKSTESGTKSQYIYCDKYAHSIGSAISSMVTSLTETRSAILSSSKQRVSHTERYIETENDGNWHEGWKTHRIFAHSVYDPIKRDFAHYPGLPPGALTESNQAEAKRRAKNPPPYLLVSAKARGKGAERVAYRCYLSDDGKRCHFGAMVAKETNVVERIEENVAFHRKFLETQDLASYFAEEFNKRLRCLPNYDPSTTPKIEFLPCSVLEIEDSSWPGGNRGLLVERMLDLDRLPYVKYNNNAGVVDGKLCHKPLNVEREFAKLHISEAIIEEDSDEDYSDGDDPSYRSQKEEDGFTPSDYLQAFSHFTYKFTGKKLIVCDLQGTFDADSFPPKIELTDPAIHYKSSQGREMVYGRTDKGNKGIQLFFNTHECTDLCKLLVHTCKGRYDWKKKYERKFLNSCYSIQNP